VFIAMMGDLVVLGAGAGAGAAAGVCPSKRWWR